MAIPPLAGWHGTTIPKVIVLGKVNELIDSCDLSTPIGTRDAAVLLRAARLAVRRSFADRVVNRAVVGGVEADIAMRRIGRSISPVEEGTRTGSGFDRQLLGADCAECAQECAHIRWEPVLMVSAAGPAEIVSATNRTTKPKKCSAYHQRSLPRHVPTSHPARDAAKHGPEHETTRKARQSNSTDPPPRSTSPPPQETPNAHPQRSP